MELTPPPNSIHLILKRTKGRTIFQKVVFPGSDNKHRRVLSGSEEGGALA